MTLCEPASVSSGAEKNTQWKRKYFLALSGLAIVWGAVYAGIHPFSTWLTFRLWGLPQHSAFGSSIEFFIYDTVKILLLLVALIYGIAWMRAALNIERVRDYLAGKGRSIGYFLGALFGSITPFCSCSSIPLFLGFTSARIPFGITMAFLIASPLINEVAIILLWGLLGWKFTIVYVIAGMLAAIIGGLFMDTIRAARWLQPYFKDLIKNAPAIYQANEPREVVSITARQRHNFAWSEMRSIFRRVWKWVIIGVGIGAVLHGFVPDNWFASHFGTGEWWTAPAAVLAGIPLYSNVTGIIPIMESLLLKGLPIGTTLAFCMSAVAASIPEFMLLRQVMTIKLQAIFVAYLWVIFTLMGWLFNYAGSWLL